MSRALLALLLAAAAAPARADTFQLVSQNCLHLGWREGTLTQQNVAQDNYKTYYLENQVLPQGDVILLQEVMRTDELPVAAVGNYWVVATGFKGQTSYKEAYVFFIRNSNVFNVFNFPVPPNNYRDYQGQNQALFSRPPSGVLVGSGQNFTWVVNFHAIFGTRVALRTNEARRMQDVLDYFATLPITVNNHQAPVTRVILAGDWNLSSNEISATWQNANQYSFLINGATSLKRDGSPSSNYDHFVLPVMNPVLADHEELVPYRTVLPNQGAITAPNFRTYVSDHRGIQCRVNYTP